MFKREDVQFASLLMDTIGFDGMRSIAEHTMNAAEKMELLQIEVTEQYKCTQCGECCKTCDAQLTDDDIVRICKHLKIGFDGFYDRYMNKSHLNNYLISPCPFLKDNKCSIYDVRPDVCKIYPFADNTLTTEPCKMGKEIWKTLVRIFGKATPSEHTQATINNMAKIRDSMIDAGRCDDVKDDVDNSNNTFYIFVNCPDIVAILKHLRQRKHRKKEMQACIGD